MRISKRIYTMAALSAFVALGIAATKPDDGYKNLKVIRKDVSHEELTRIMHGFNDALGVHCDFCHAKSKDNEEHLDFASDEKPEKTIARKMIKMTNKINKKFFHAKDKIGTEKGLLAVNCATCHHGSPHPEIKVEKEGPEQ